MTSTEDTSLETEPTRIPQQRNGWKRYAIDARPLRHAPFRRMFIGSATSFFGAQFTMIAVPIQIYSITHQSLWVGIASFAGLVPLLVFALWGGALADILDRRKLLLSSSLLMWLMTLALLAQSALHLNNRWLLIGLVAVQSGAVAVSMPTRSAIIPRIVPKSEIAQANTLNFTMANAAQVLGPLAAGVMIAHYGITPAYLVDALTFTVAMWAALGLPAMPPMGRPTTKRSGAWADVLFGLRYLATTPILLLSFAIDIVAMVLAQPRALFPAAADETFGKGSIAWLYSAIAIGAVAAGLSSGWIARVRRQGLALILAVIAWGIAIAFSGLTHRLWLVVVLLAVGGAADLVSAVYRQTMLQTYTSDELRGRMQGVFTAVVAGGPRLGDLRAGFVAAAVSTRFAWVSGGIACVVLAILIGVSFPALARYRAPDATIG